MNGNAPVVADLVEHNIVFADISCAHLGLFLRISMEAESTEIRFPTTPSTLWGSCILQLALQYTVDELSALTTRSAFRATLGDKCYPYILHEAHQQDLLLVNPQERRQSERWHLENTAPEIIVGILDIAGFKEINDRKSRAVADMLITAAGQAINEMTDPSVLSGRDGGDEFVLVLAQPKASEETMRAILQRIESKFLEIVAESVPQLDTKRLSTPLGFHQSVGTVNMRELIAIYREGVLVESIFEGRIDEATLRDALPQLVSLMLEPMYRKLKARKEVGV